MFISMYSKLGWASFCMNYCINAPWHEGNQFVALLRCNESPGCFDSGLQVTCIAGSVFLIFLLTIPHIFSMGFRSGEFAGQSSTVTPWSSNQLLVPLAVWAGACCPAGIWNQHLHKACQQKEAWSAINFPGRWLRWLWTSENTTDQHQQMTWQPKSSLTVETSHGTSSNMDSVPLHSSSRLWDLDFQMKCKIYFHLKRGLSGATVQFFFSLAQVRCFWWCFCFRSDLVALFLKTSECGDSWWTDSSFSSLLVKLSQVFESALLDSILKLAVFPVACATFSYLMYSFQSTLHLICVDAALCEEPNLSVMTLCDLPSLWKLSMIVFGTTAKSTVFHIIVVSKNKRYPKFILYGWTFIDTQMYILEYLEILKFWLSWAVSSNHKKKKKIPLKCFTLHVMILKYMKVSLFETFSRYSNFFRCTCILIPPNLG